MNMPVLKEKVCSKMVDTLRDTRCSGVVVKCSLVDQQQLTGKMHVCGGGWHGEKSICSQDKQ